MSLAEDVRAALASREPDPSALCDKVREMWPGLCADVQSTIMGDISDAMVDAHPVEIGGGRWAELWSWCVHRADWAGIRVLACSEQCAAKAADGGARVATAYPGESCDVCGAVVDGGPGWRILAALLAAVEGGR